MLMKFSRSLIPVLYGAIFIASAFTGFIYTDRYSGWGHYYANAVPVGLGLGLVVGFMAAIVVSHMRERAAKATLGGISVFWILFALAIYWNAPEG